MFWSSGRALPAPRSASGCPTTGLGSCASSRVIGWTELACPKRTSTGRCAAGGIGRPTPMSAGGRRIIRWEVKATIRSMSTCTTRSAGARSASRATTGALPPRTSGSRRSTAWASTGRSHMRSWRPTTRSTRPRLASPAWLVTPAAPREIRSPTLPRRWDARASCLSTPMKSSAGTGGRPSSPSPPRHTAGGLPATTGAGARSGARRDRSRPRTWPTGRVHSRTA